MAQGRAKGTLTAWGFTLSDDERKKSSQVIRHYSAWGVHIPYAIRPQVASDGFGIKVTSFGLIVWPGRVANLISWKDLVRGDKVCAYCLSQGKMTADHIMPQVHGGKTNDNLTASCQPCNTKKGSTGLLQFLIQIGGIKCSEDSSIGGRRSMSTHASTTMGWGMAQPGSTVGFPVLKAAFQSALGGENSDTAGHHPGR
jgi:hypothetical protein